MAEDQNLTNLGDGNLAGSGGQLPTDQASSNSDGNVGSGSASGTGGGAFAKKPKTEKQRERERERRRRRRRKKPALKAGEDVPLILSSNVGKEKGHGPSDAALREMPGVAEEMSAHAVDVPKIPDMADSDHLSEGALEPESAPEVVSMESSEPIAEQSEQIPAQTLPSSETISAAGEEALSEQALPDEQPLIEPEEVVPEPPQDLSPPSESHGLEESQQIFEESPSYAETYQEEKPTEAVDELPMHDEDAHADLLSEEDLQHVRKQEAQNLANDLHGEELTQLEEMPQKQWILGNLLKTLGGIVVLFVLVVGAFWLGSSLHLPDLFKGWFTSKPAEELVQGDNTQVVQDTELFRRWGFQTAVIMGRNQGDLRDLAYNVFFNANYFGKLKDPVFYGETGVTAALYYGFGRDAEYLRNRFIYYVKYLAQVRQANQVKVADVLDGKLRRDLALDDYIADLKAVFDQGNTLRKEINVQIDDLKVSINSLNPDKDRYEVDFFASLAETEAEKADTLIAKFIEVSQKQTDLKAKLAALSKLAEYYEEDLIAMKLRIEGLEQNREALIEGVTVREVPGSGIDLIRE